MQSRRTPEEESLWQQFPANAYVRRLLDYCQRMGIHLGRSGVQEQWLYHPAYRTIYIWVPDLAAESLSYMVVILAHELGHAADFDQHPKHVELTRDLHWSQIPDFIEKAAFVNGFRILKELHIPISLDHYAGMINDGMASDVVSEIEQDHLCCLMSEKHLISVPA